MEKAALRGELINCSILKDEGADLSICNKEGLTPSDLAKSGEIKSLLQGESFMGLFLLLLTTMFSDLTLIYQ